MSAKDKGRPGSGQSGSGKRRDPVTIDLKATSVKTGPGQSPAPAAGATGPVPETAPVVPPAVEPVEDVVADAPATRAPAEAPAPEPAKAAEAGAVPAPEVSAPNEAALADGAPSAGEADAAPAAARPTPTADESSTARMTETRPETAAEPPRAAVPPRAEEGEAAAAVPARERSIGGPLAAAAVAGALLGFGGSWLLAHSGRWPGGEGVNARLVDIERRLQETGRADPRLAEAERRADAGFQAAGRVAALDARVAEIEKNSSQVPDLAMRLAALDKAATERAGRLEAVEGDVKALKNAPPPPPSVPPERVEELEKRFLAELAIVRGNFEQAMDAARKDLSGESARIAESAKALSDRLAAAEKATQDGLAAAAKATEEGLAAADRTSAERVAGVDKAAADRVAAAAKEISDRLAAGDAALDGRIAELSNTVKTETARLDAVQKGAERTELKTATYEDYRKTVDVLFARVAAFEEMRKRLDGVAGQVAALEELKGRVEANASGLQAATGKIDQLGGRVAAVDQLSAAVKATSDKTAAVESRFGTISDRIGSIEQFAQKGADARTDAVLALSLGELKGAVDSGRPFPTELTTAATVGRGRVDLALLEPHAPKGVPTTAALIDGFGSVAKRILTTTAAAQAPGGGEGFLDKMLGQASQAVTIRKVGEASGDSVEARVARMEDRLKARDLPAALAEWKTLPEPARKASADWGAAVEARVTVDKAIQSVTQSVVAKLVQTGQ
ncbi:hypothetical protein [Prosthecomicrobium sp. N25]|uniref:hypothetical protein n=1 Tax=Prosthecomicrobium sp. N25 TaxID=3129254 RepID=UPI003076A017